MTLSTLTDTERGLNEGKLYVHVVWSYIKRPRSWRRPPPGCLWTMLQHFGTGGKARARTPT